MPACPNSHLPRSPLPRSPLRSSPVAARDNDRVPPPAAVSAVRLAVRRFLGAAERDGSAAPLVVACSGGPDSLALAAAARYVVRDAPVHGLVVDHGLQEGSSEVAARAARQLTDLGCDRAQVLTARVDGGGGPEAAARRARYAALDRARPAGSSVLLGHTLDDQAETVLLGLGRGSGARSLAGMPAHDPPWGRPFLGLERETTVAACRALDLEPWQDPHNQDPRFTRVRLRTEVLPLLEDALQGGVAPALARSAAQLREDADALDRLAVEVRERAERRLDQEPAAGIDVAELEPSPAALRRRVLRDWLLSRGVPEVTDAHLRAADALVGDWRGQGGHRLPGSFVLRRARGTLLVEAEGAKRPNG